VLGPASATDLTIHLAGTVPLVRKVVKYTCDDNGEKLGVPTGPFAVEYITGGDNGLVVVPISGKSIVFANVIAASGARYTARQYTWWEAQGQVTFSSDGLNGKAQSICRPVK